MNAEGEFAKNVYVYIEGAVRRTRGFFFSLCRAYPHKGVF